jgi:hypothetical protein
VAGSYSFAVQVTDSYSNTDTQDLFIAVETPTISGVTIARNGDTSGSSVTVSWTISPSSLGVDLYTKTGDFSGTATEWTLSSSNITTGSYIDTVNTVANGTNKYYKVIVHGETLEDADLDTDVAGKFDLSVGPSDTEPEKLFISIPLTQSDDSLSAILGSQVQSMDMVLTFNISKEVIAGTMYTGSSWTTYPGVSTLISELELGYAYAYITNSSRYLTVVGTVPTADYSRTLVGGNAANWIASPYPVSVAVASAGLNSSSHVTSLTSITNAAAVYQFDADAELIDGTNGIAYHYPNSSSWYGGTLSSSSSLVLTPGRGYMLTEPVKSSFTWTLTKPY